VRCVDAEILYFFYLNLHEMLLNPNVFSTQVKRAFLHYDFPDFSTGVVRAKAGASANRRGEYQSTYEVFLDCIGILMYPCVIM
jgi:hypothetical protein